MSISLRDQSYRLSYGLREHRPQQQQLLVCSGGGTKPMHINGSETRCRYELMVDMNMF